MANSPTSSRLVRLIALVALALALACPPVGAQDSTGTVDVDPTATTASTSTTTPGEPTPSTSAAASPVDDPVVEGTGEADPTGPIPFTGREVMWLAVAGLAAIVAGTAFTYAARRRR